MLNEYSGTGIISTKEFIDCFMKLIVMSVRIIIKFIYIFFIYIIYNII